MLYMVIETFKENRVKDVYNRAKQCGRMLPKGLNYIESWVEPTFTRCFQLMETENEYLFQEWISKWQDLVQFDVIPVITSEAAAQLINDATHRQQ